MNKSRSRPKLSLFLATLAVGLLFVSLPSWWARPTLPFPYWIYGMLTAIALIACAAKLTPGAGLRTSAPIDDPTKRASVDGGADGEA
jgi:hypothetical protein